MANTWQGEFPWQNLPKLDGCERTSLVGSFAPNGYGRFDMTGNVWEWTSDWFTFRHPDADDSPCCVPKNPRVTSPDASYDVGSPGEQFPRKVIRGGSHLRAPNNCSATGPRRGRRRRSTRPWRTSGSGASSDRRLRRRLTEGSAR